MTTDTNHPLVTLETRLWATTFYGGNAVFADLKEGDRFTFPKHPESVFTKTKAGWFRTDDGRKHRTGRGTAVVKEVA